MFICSPSEAEKQPRVLKIVFVTGKMTNVMEYITFLILHYYAHDFILSFFAIS